MPYFLICAFVGSAILAIANSYEKRITAESKEEKEYLAALSAAEFLKEQLVCCEGEWTLGAGGTKVEEETENKVQKELLETVYGFCKEYVKYPKKAGKEILLEIALEDELGENPTIPAVEVHITLEADDKAEVSESDLEEALGMDSEDLEESIEVIVPIQIYAEIFLDGKKKRIMSLSVKGTVVYEPESTMELYWDEMYIQK